MKPTMQHTLEDARALGTEAWLCGDLATSNHFDRAASPASHRAWAYAWASATEVPGAARDDVERA